MPQIEEHPQADIDNDGQTSSVKPADPEKKWGWLKITLILVVIGGFGYCASGVIKKQSRMAAMTTASSNMRSVFYLMVEFDGDFGHFPDDKSALYGHTGDYSNDYFAQFLHHGYTTSEEVFYAKGGSLVLNKPDNDISSPERMLEAGECGFAYYKGMSTRDYSSRPLLFAPMTGKGFKFNRKIYNGLAIVLHLDGSVKHYSIDENGDAVLPSGKKLFEGGKGSPWGDKGPDAKNLLFPK